MNIPPSVIDDAKRFPLPPPKPAPVRVMVDLETWGTAPGSAIASIGAVKFDESGVTDKFYMRVDVSSCLKAGMKIDFSTVQWWMKQSEEARQEMGKDGMKLDRVLMEFRAFCKYTIGSMEKGEIELWGNGAAFDNAILSEAYRLCGIEQPWKFWNDRCYRTIKGIFPHIKMPARVGTHHNALDDAKTQALHLIEILAHHEAANSKTMDMARGGFKKVQEELEIARAELATAKGELERMQAKRQSFDEWWPTYMHGICIDHEEIKNASRESWNAALASAPVDDPEQSKLPLEDDEQWQKEHDRNPGDTPKFLESLVTD